MGKISWLAQGTRPDLSFSSLNLAKKNNSATISDLWNVNRLVDKVKNEENKVIYGKIGNRETLQVVGIVDASYKSDKKSIGGMMIVLTNENMTKVIDELVYMSRHVEILLYRDYRKRMNVRI